MPPGEEVDYEELEEYLRALGYSNRLELLNLLRVPTALGDIHLEPGRLRAGSNPERPLSRPAIMEHLEKLIEAGLVEVREPSAGRRSREFVVNPRKLYYVTEEFRKLSTLHVSAAAGRDATVNLETAGAAPMEAGPKLVLVHGALEGKVFPLRRNDLGGERGWVLGRKAGLHVSLGYDPYVSLENSEVILEDGRHVLLDLRTSKNGTLLNWRRLGKDERVPLKPGDVVGLGRSLLVFRLE